MSMRCSRQTSLASILLLCTVTGCGAPVQQDSPASASTDESTSTTTSVAEAMALSTAPTTPIDVTAPGPVTLPDVVPPTVDNCVDAGSQLAPTSLPAGWQRFVLAARPTGTCGQSTYLMMSLVLPGPTDGPGKLVTITTSPAAGSTLQQGEPVDINGFHGTIARSAMADGTPTVSINIVINGVFVDAHGDADESELTAIIASIAPVDDSEWANLVSEVVHAP